MSLESILKGAKKPLPTAEVEIKRLSTETEKAIFKIRAMNFSDSDRVQGVKDEEVFEVATCCVEPNFKSLIDPDEKIFTVEDAVKAYLLPGEVQKLAAQIRSLSGYYADSVVEVLKNV